VLHVGELTKIQRLEWKVRVLTFASILSVLIIVACGWTFRQQQSDVLRVRQIVIVDEKGTERVWIGAPVPDPIVQGQRQKRAGPVSGIILLDAKGNERSGYVTSDGSGEGIHEPRQRKSTGDTLPRKPRWRRSLVDV
jgi:hypothetical protein